MQTAKSIAKQIVSDKQNNICALSGDILDPVQALNDADLIVPKTKGGKITVSNIAIVEPVAHMKKHGNYREREIEIETLKSVIDNRNQVMKLYNKFNNQLLAAKRKCDRLTPETKQWMEEQVDIVKKKLAEHDRILTKEIKRMSKKNGIIAAALGVKGIGPVTIAYCIVYLDPAKANHASSFWKYAGLHCASRDRYVKGQKGGGNKTLRTVLYTMADSQLKTRGAYREVYDNYKTRLQNSQKETMTTLPGGKVEKMPWCDVSDGHRHGAALRVIMKHFLADFWMISRQYYGLPVSMLYPQAQLGGTHRTIMPDERGWILP